MIERVALGCALFGGLGSLPGLQDQGIARREAFRLMDAAWDLGLRRFDTADAYGGGISETWIGEWRRRSGKPVHVTTKTFNPIVDGGDRGLTPARVRRQIAGTLERLDAESVAVYLAHEWDPDVPITDVVGVFEELVADGMVEAFGFSNITAPQLRSVLPLATPAVVQNSYSLLLAVDDAALIPICTANGVTYEAYSPLAGGWLSGKYRPGEPLPADSRMALAPQWYPHIDPVAASRAVEALGAHASEMGISTAALALAWVLHSPGVGRMIVGPKRLDHLEHVAAACSTELTSQERAELAGLFAA